ncbi:MAG TPA: copper resistance CopC family protein [Jiangellaceae bacterium]
MRRALVLVAAVAFVVVSATPAAAHTTLIDSKPEDGVTLTGPPAEVTLEFNEPVQQDFTQVAVLDADDDHYEDGAPQVVGAIVTQAVRDLPTGDYRISYRVGSSDGHPVTGVLTFTVAAQAEDSAEPSQTPGQTRPPVQTPPPVETEAPEPVEQPTTTGLAAAGEEDSGSSLRWLGAGAAVAAAAALLFALRRRPGGGAAPPGSDTGQQ